jgi:hypothetical protein
MSTKVSTIEYESGVIAAAKLTFTEESTEAPRLASVIIGLGMVSVHLETDGRFQFLEFLISKNDALAFAAAIQETYMEDNDEE